jgi:hypothetical protein
MLPPEVGQPDRCRQCGQLYTTDQLIYQGEDLEPICLPCLRQIDPVRAQILANIPRRR